MTRSGDSSHFRASGKLLLTGEYAVLDGALAWAVPTRYGQELKASAEGEGLQWVSLNHKGKSWFKAKWNKDGTLIHASDKETSALLDRLIRAGMDLGSPVSPYGGWHIEMAMDFPAEWGLGTSSSLVVCIAQWLNVDAMDLFYRAMTGSGYDVAVAAHGTGILFKRQSDGYRVEIALQEPSFHEHLYFCYTGKKQNSQSEVQRYTEIPKEQRQKLVEPVSLLTHQALRAASLTDFQQVILDHEHLLADVLSLPPLNTVYPEISGALKHLGAWGGDFILLASNEPRDLATLREAGIEHCYNWGEILR